MSGLTFERDCRKAGANLRKHEVGFEAVETAFPDDRALVIRVQTALHQEMEAEA